MKPAPKYFAVWSCCWQSQCCLLLTVCTGGWRSHGELCLPKCQAAPGVSGLSAENQKPDRLNSKCTFWDNSKPLSWKCQECLDESIMFTEPDTSGSASPKIFPFALLSPVPAPEMGVDISGEEN